MPSPEYPTGTVRALLPTAHVSEPTRAALQERLAAPAAPYEPQLLAPETFALLEAVAARIYPQPDRPDHPIAIAPAIDERLAAGQADGWRYDSMPPDREAYRLGLGGIDEIAQILFQKQFIQLPAEQQDKVIAALASGTPPGEHWQTVDPKRFFEEMLAEMTENYYAHPLAQEEIGYVGMADLLKWANIGLNEKDEREVPMNANE